MKKPNIKDYGWNDQHGFDDEPPFWILGGENAYYAALKEWQLSGKIDVYNEIMEFLDASEGFSEAGFEMLAEVKSEIEALFNKAKNQPKQ